MWPQKLHWHIVNCERTHRNADLYTQVGLWLVGNLQNDGNLALHTHQYTYCLWLRPADFSKNCTRSLSLSFCRLSQGVYVSVKSHTLKWVADPIYIYNDYMAIIINCQQNWMHMQSHCSLQIYWAHKSKDINIHYICHPWNIFRSKFIYTWGIKCAYK